MSTKIEPNRNFVAHGEKSKFLIFRPEIPYGGLRNVVVFCFLKYVFERHKNIKKVRAPEWWKKHLKLT